MNSPNKTLRSHDLWKSAYAIAQFTYEQAAVIVAEYPDEKWTIATKLRNSASDYVLHVSEAISDVPESSEYDWSNAKRSLFALQSIYILATKQKLLETDPDIIVKIDAILAAIEKNITASKEAKQAKKKEELESWLEKYQIWQKIQN